jgi:UDP-N-acetylglucosamine--N-acetylmuramyl-(pentapeptide) pyrophosphoryl-undecaprenol N-acetylglucosamine transferase
MRVVLVGGGSGGSVAPLLAIVEKVKEGDLKTEFIFIGTKRGYPEREMIKNYGFKFFSVFSGKLRRYFSFKNFIDPALIIFGFFQSLFLFKKNKPDLIIGAGAYVSVPVILAGWFLKIPAIIHQQDIVPSLSNKILVPFVKKITVSFEKSLNDFPKNKSVFIGNPVRGFILEGDRERAIKRFNLERSLPTLLVLGGGTGALFLNELIWQNIKKLTEFCQIIHLTGREKFKIKNLKLKIDRYHPYEFLNEEIADAYAVADLVVSRAGMNVLSELAVLGKPTIIVPIPDSHQEANARYFQEKNAAVVLDQKGLTGEKISAEIKELINNSKKRKNLEENIKKIFPLDAAKKFAKEIMEFGIKM